MIVIEKNIGPKIPYDVVETQITFNDELTLNLASKQDDEPVHIDICFNKGGKLIVGTKDAWSYVAEIDIPKREYEEPEDAEEAPVPLPLDMDKVKLTLWAIGR